MSLFARQRYSPLTLRILAVNIMALLMLAGGLLYLGRYEDQLLAAEFETLSFEAHFFAGALGEGAVIDSSEEEFSVLAPELARSMVRRLVEASESRVRLFEENGALVADSRMLASRRKAIEIERIEPPTAASPTGWLRWLNWDRHWPRQNERPLYNEQPTQQAAHYPIARHALQGTEGQQLWQMADGRLLLGVAVPVQSYKQILGAVLVTRNSASINSAIAEVRAEVISIFLAVLAVTILLSLYLARTIVKPLQLLARAVRDVQIGQTQSVTMAQGLGGAAALLASREIPNLTRRGDEVGELSHALREMTAALATRLNAIENFAADVAHELKNPLTSLRSAVETAERIKDPQRLATLMRIIRDDVDRMDRLISDIANASRLDAELSRTETAVVSVKSLLETLVNLYDPTQAATESTVSAPIILLTTSIPDTWQIQGVESRLMQVFRNLVENARSFAPPGSSVRLAATAQDNQISITVDDDGPGIPPNKLDAIFDRFYSERPQQEKFGQHSGLGLSIARQIIAAHRGNITADNRMAEDGTIAGARFTVTLPRA